MITSTTFAITGTRGQGDKGTRGYSSLHRGRASLLGLPGAAVLPVRFELAAGLAAYEYTK